MTDLLASCIPVIGNALLHFVWQGGVVGIVASLALFALRHARPQTRYAVACTALLACLLAPLISIALHIAEGSAASAAADTDATGLFIATASAASPAVLADWTSPAAPWLPTLVAMWAAGACVLCLRMALGVAWIQRLRNAPQPPAQAQWQARLDALASRFGLARHVELRLVEGMDSPASAGWWRPVVLLPAALVTRMPVDLIEALLAHELAHVRRHDYLVNLLQGLVESLLFYHPVVWWLSRQIRNEREHIADQLAAQATGHPRRLAHALSELSELTELSRSRRAGCAPPRLAQAAHGGHLMSRIEQLVRPGRRTAAGRIAFPLIGVATACLAFYAHAQITADTSKAATSTPPPAAQAAAAAVQPRPLPQPAPAPAARGVLDLPSAPTPLPTPLTFEPVDAAALSESISSSVASSVASAFATADAVVHVGHGDNRNAYAIVRKSRKGITMSGSTDDIREVEALRRSIDGDFLWFRRDGRAYTVTDPATVARAARAWQDSEAIGRQMEALGREMEAHGRNMNVLGAQMGKLAGQQRGPSPEMLQAQRRIGELAGRQGQLAARHAQLSAGRSAMTEADEARIEREVEAMEARLEAQMEAIEEQIEREAEKIEAAAERAARNSEPMEALGRRMEEAAKPMEALGERMEVLGDRHERVAERAERETRELISEAIERGVARPAPRATSTQ